MHRLMSITRTERVLQVPRKMHPLVGQGSLGTIKGGVPLWEAPPTLAGIWKNWTAKIVLRSGRPHGSTAGGERKKVVISCGD